MSLFKFFMVVCLFFLTLTFVLLYYSKSKATVKQNAANNSRYVKPVELEIREKEQSPTWREEQRKQRKEYVEMVSTPKPESKDALKRIENLNEKLLQ